MDLEIKAISYVYKITKQNLDISNSQAEHFCENFLMSEEFSSLKFIRMLDKIKTNNEKTMTNLLPHLKQWSEDYRKPLVKNGNYIFSKAVQLLRESNSVFCSLNTIAQKLCSSNYFVSSLIKKGELPAYKFGSYYRVSMFDYKMFLNRSKITADKLNDLDDQNNLAVEEKPHNEKPKSVAQVEPKKQEKKPEKAQEVKQEKKQETKQEKPTEKAVEKKVEKVVEKPIEKSVEKKAEKSIEKTKEAVKKEEDKPIKSEKVSDKSKKPPKEADFIEPPSDDEIDDVQPSEQDNIIPKSSVNKVEEAPFGATEISPDTFVQNVKKKYMDEEPTAEEETTESSSEIQSSDIDDMNNIDISEYIEDVEEKDESLKVSEEQSEMVSQLMLSESKKEEKKEKVVVNNVDDLTKEVQKQAVEALLVAENPILAENEENKETNILNPTKKRMTL